jgi:metallo-beta-lactamase class B
MGPFSEDGYRWTDHPEYLSDYRASVAWLETVGVDICLAAHPSQMRLIERIETKALVDPGVCSRNAASIQNRIDIIIKEEQGR